jgi:hypothetical protein
VTSLRRRLDNVFAELVIIREALQNGGSSPPCCIKFHQKGRISCDLIGPFPKEMFLRECKRCRSQIAEFMNTTISKKM